MENQPLDFVTSPEQIQKMMGAVGKTVFEYILNKIKEIGKRFETITYHEYKFMLENMGVEVMTKDDYEAMKKFIKFYTIEIVEKIKNMEDETAEIVSNLALEKLSDMGVGAISDDQWIDLIMNSKNKVKV